MTAFQSSASVEEFLRIEEHSILPFVAVGSEGVKYSYDFLKKHLPLHEYSKLGLSAVRKSFWCVLASDGRGLFLNFTCIPLGLKERSPIYNTAALKAKALNRFNAVFNEMAQRLRDLPPEDLKRLGGLFGLSQHSVTSFETLSDLL